MGVKGYPIGQNYIKGNEGIYAPVAYSIGKWLAGWSYRKPITLSRASGAVSNYQMKLLVGESDSAGTMNVSCGGLCASDFDDIRFTNSNGNVLDYWIESISGTTPNQVATIWIEFDSIGTGATTFYLYYGNATASAASSGANTFIVFDDMERGNDGDTIGGSWTEVTSHCHISTAQKYAGSRGAMFVGDADGALSSIPVSYGDISISVRFYMNALSALYFYGSGDGTKIPFIFGGPGVDTFAYYDTAARTITATVSTNTWTEFEFRNFNWSAYTYDILIGGSVKKTGAAMTLNAATNLFVGNYGNPTTTKDLWVDNLFIRQYLATEPAWGIWGAQES